jgi:hypothetical protein
MSHAAQSTRRPPDYSNGLPADIHAESVVLGCILTGQLPLDAVLGDDFQDLRHRTIFQQMRELQKASRPIDAPTLSLELDRRKELRNAGGTAYITELDDLPQVIHPEQYVVRIQQKARRRVIIQHADLQAKRALLDTEPVDTLIASGADFYRDLRTKNGHPAEAERSIPAWPDPLGEDAFHGVAGDLVRLIAPHSESDPAALLLQFLAAFGSMVGRGPYYQVEGDYHHTNLYVVIVGSSSKGRKGTSWGRVRNVLADIDEHWAENCIIRGLGSGEGLIDALGGENPDKRCLIQEAEFARILSVISRDGTTLSPILRDAYDGGSLAIRTRLHKIPPIKGTHVSVIAHITRDELRRRLNDSEIANGFANRMLWVCAARSKELPEGGGSPKLDELTKRIKEATDFTRRLGNTRVLMDEAAMQLWRDVTTI